MLHFQKKQNMRNNIKKNIPFYVMFIPVLIYFVIFRYVPLLLSLIISLEKYQPAKGIFSSKWVGIEYYKQFINSVFFWRLIRNTLGINFLQLTVGFVAPIILALLLNEVGRMRYKKLVQTVTYLPNFISSVVVVGMVVTFLSPSTGLVNNILAHLGMERINFLTEPSYFWGIYTVMTIWQTAGYSAIIYLASLTGISSELYEAARIDGAGRWAQLFNITLPGLTPTIVLLFLMKIGRVLDVGYETIVLMYNPSIYSTADVIGTYVYRRGILNGEYSFASAVGFFQSVIGLMLVLFANKIAKKTSETSLW
ncbi:sugar ABC transporter permease [Eisenbergiella massiliensis]|uniref:Sugar ABC transporter permease n=2 Tax=Eisenbergiella massiliensis TaxID=1720294 RepID=A0A3E3I8A7_9FIRM|nr:sugar ABC transporter permease [Eisenbergiella massiliensis]RGE74713.1 sugar ABC transporter permease [Eisenbergiella massiliensis]